MVIDQSTCIGCGCCTLACRATNDISPEKMPLDDVILDGSSSVDEAMLAGESLPVSKKAGDEVIGATLNKTGAFKCRATKVGKDTTLAQIVKMVQDAQNTKAPIARLAHIVSG